MHSYKYYRTLLSIVDLIFLETVLPGIIISSVVATKAHVLLSPPTDDFQEII